MLTPLEFLSRLAAHRPILPTVNHLTHVYANNRRDTMSIIARLCVINSGSTISHPERADTKSVSSCTPPHAAGELPDSAVEGVSSLAGSGLCMGCSCQATPFCPQVVKLTEPHGFLPLIMASPLTARIDILRPLRYFFDYPKILFETLNLVLTLTGCGQERASSTIRA